MLFFLAAEGSLAYLPELDLALHRVAINGA
jgi:hypothetical protein